MTNEKAAEILRQYNEWRMDCYDAADCTFSSEELTEAIDTAIVAIDPPIELTIDGITEAVSRKSGFSVNAILSKHRYRDICEARWTIWYVVRWCLNLSVSTIAKHFHRDYHTVTHGLDMVSGFMQNERLNTAWNTRYEPFIRRVEQLIDEQS